MVPDVSPSGSFKGWLFGVWLQKNKAFVKAVLSIYFAFLSTVALADASTHLTEIGGASLVTVLVLLAKLGLDAVDFFASDVELKP